MASLREKIQTALDEARILLLGTQVLLGFEYRAFFEQRFEAMPEGAKLVKLASLSLMLLAFALLVSPGAYHRVAAGGEDREDVHRFATAMLGVALLPLALGLALDVAFAVLPVLGSAGAAAGGAAVAGGALGAWYAFTAARRDRRAARKEADVEETKLEDKIRHVLTEARMVLPGAQALLGFQLAGTLVEPFAALPRTSQLVHVAALGFIAVAVILLMTPAAYHRIVERGEGTERFHRVAGRLVVAALGAIAVGLAADVYVVFRKVLHADAPAIAAALAGLALCLGLWFGLTLALRARRAAGSRAAEAHP